MAVALACLVVGVRPAAAEWFLDLYGGGALTQSHHISLDGDLDSTDVAGLLKGVSFEKSFSVGGRGGYWFESVKFFGLGLDVSHFRPDIKAQTVKGEGVITDSRGVLLGVPISVSGGAPVKLAEVDFRVTAVSFDLMLRWPLLVSTKFPHGQLQPYVTAGPAAYLSDLQRFQTAASHGSKTAGGAIWQLTKHVGIFGEYRYTHLRPSLHSGEITLKTHLSTHHFLTGFSFRY